MEGVFSPVETCAVELAPREICSALYRYIGSESALGTLRVVRSE